MKTVSRREFLKGAALSAAGLATGLLPAVPVKTKGLLRNRPLPKHLLLPIGWARRLSLRKVISSKPMKRMF